MRNNVLLLACILPLACMARPLQHRSYPGIALHKYAGNTMAKLTGASKRVAAYSYLSSGQVQDSMHYYYSGGRGSDITTNQFSDNYRPNNYSEYQGISSDKTIQWSATGGKLAITRVKDYSYDSKNAVTGNVDSAATVTKYTVTRKANGLRDFLIMDQNAVPTAKTFFYYDASLHLLQDSIASLVTFTPVGKDVYNYDASGNMVEYIAYDNEAGLPAIPKWTAAHHFFYTYDSKNRMTKVMHEQYNYFTKQNENKSLDSFSYKGNDTLVSEEYNFTWGSTSWTPADRTIFTYNAAGSTQSYIAQIWNNTKWDTTERDMYTYDAANLLQRINGYKYNNGSFSLTPYDQTTVYYEDYFPAAIGNISAAKTLALYPNPATGILHLPAIDAMGSVCIYDNTGKTVFQKTGVNMRNCTLDISSYPAGQYHVQAATADEVLSGSFIKQ